MNAAQHYDMIDWQKETVTKPPITKPLKRDKILASINEGILPEALPYFSCHSQAIEQHVKLVTEASFQVSPVEVDLCILPIIWYSSKKSNAGILQILMCLVLI